MLESGKTLSAKVTAPLGSSAARLVDLTPTTRTTPRIVYYYTGLIWLLNHLFNCIKLKEEFIFDNMYLIW